MAAAAIVFVGGMLGLRNDLAVHIVLTILGDNVQTMRRSSRSVIAWLQVVLADPPPGPAAARARTLLDRLAASGDDWALSVQQDLEA